MGNENMVNGFTYFEMDGITQKVTPKLGNSHLERKLMLKAVEELRQQVQAVRQEINLSTYKLNAKLGDDNGIAVDTKEITDSLDTLRTLRNEANEDLNAIVNYPAWLEEYLENYINEYVDKL